MRVHGELKVIDGNGAPLFSWPLRLLLASVAGFLFWSAVIAAIRQLVSFV
jgi:hypothetical protein